MVGVGGIDSSDEEGQGGFEIYKQAEGKSDIGCVEEEEGLDAYEKYEKKKLRLRRVSGLGFGV